MQTIKTPNSRPQSPAVTTQTSVDNLVDSMLDFSGYDNGSYESASMSPVDSKTSATFSQPTTSNNSGMSLFSTGQPMSGPSHEYNRYKQQTGIVPGALATTMAVNQNNAQIAGYAGLDIDAYLGLDSSYDFNTSPSQHTEMEMDFDQPLFQEQTINPNVMGGQELTSFTSPSPVQSQSSIGQRMYPGVHQQAALAKQQAQQKQQVMQQQQQQHQQRPAPQPAAAKPRNKSAQPSDPLVEQKITQLLNSMRAKSSSATAEDDEPMSGYARAKKDEEDMDEDERLLASEEGKKLSSKERRQLRNKVSARAFRSRRKEYITQLESEIAGKVSENGDLRAQNRMLVEENKRLQDLTRMLLSSSSFSDFLTDLSSNPAALAPVPQQLPTQSAQAPPAKSQESRPIPKDVNASYAMQHVSQLQQIGVAMIPEQTIDFSMLTLDQVDAYSFQPQVYTAVLETPEIDVAALSGKASSHAVPLESREEKIEMPVIEHHVPKLETPTQEAVVDEAFEANPEFALYHTPSTSAANAATSEDADIFGGIKLEKAFARITLVDATETQAGAESALARVQKMSERMESVTKRLERIGSEL